MVSDANAGVGEGEVPGFTSALDYTEVRDFAYPPFHPLHYGIPLQQDHSGAVSDGPAGPGSSAGGDQGYDDGDRFDDGPPWQEDADLDSPVITVQDKGDRLSRQYEFSVASADEIHGRAVALFDFTPENDNEAPLREGQIVWISYRHGQGWLVSEDPDTGETGLVPEQYVQLLKPEDEVVEVYNSPEGDIVDVYNSPEADPDGWVDEGAVGNEPEPARSGNSDDNNNNNDNNEDAALASKASSMSLGSGTAP